MWWWKAALTTESWGSWALGQVIVKWIKETAHNENRTEESRGMKRGYCVRKGDGIDKKEEKREYSETLKRSTEEISDIDSHLFPPFLYVTRSWKPISSGWSRRTVECRVKKGERNLWWKKFGGNAARISADSASISMNFYFSFLLELFASLHGTSQHESYRKE